MKDADRNMSMYFLWFMVYNVFFLLVETPTNSRSRW